MFFKEKKIQEQMKNQEQMIEIAKNFLSGKINFEELIDVFLRNNKILTYFSNYTYKNRNRNFYTKEQLEKLDNTYWVRHDLYNQMYSFLYVIGIEFDEYVPEYAIYRKIDKVCPEWFQADIFFLQKKFNNLIELIESNQLEEELKKLCKCQDGNIPNWLQGAKWPIINGEPAVFVKQSMLPEDMKWDDNIIKYYFVDKDGKEIIIKQYS